MEYSIDTNDYLKISSNSFLHRSVEAQSKLIIGNNTIIERNCIIGKLHRTDLLRIIKRDKSKEMNFRTSIGNNCHIQAGTIIYSGVEIGSNVICCDYSYIGQYTTIGDFTKIHYKAQIFKRVKIGEYSRIGGFICNDCVIGKNCSIYGTLIHRYSKHGGTPEDTSPDGVPKVEENVVIAFNSTLIGGVTIGKNSYIAAGAIVTKDISPNSLVKNVNEVVPNPYQIQDL